MVAVVWVELDSTIDSGANLCYVVGVGRKGIRFGRCCWDCDYISRFQVTDILSLRVIRGSVLKNRLRKSVASRSLFCLPYLANRLCKAGLFFLPFI